jgi:transketolase
MTEAKIQNRKRKTSLRVITEMGMGWIHDEYHAWHGKAPNDAQLENALAQNYTGGELELLRLLITNF